jgi:hypothetical protein
VGLLSPERAACERGVEAVRATLHQRARSFPGAGTTSIDLTFQQPACALAPRAGDLIELAAGGAIGTGFGELLTAFDPLPGHAPACLVTVSPTPGAGPLDGVSPSASFELRFDELLDPRAVDPTGAFALAEPSQPGNQAFGRFVVATTDPAIDLDVFTLAPAVPLSHAAGASEVHDLRVLGGAGGLTDLAGNPLADPLGALPVTLDASAPAITSGGISLRFDSADENGDGTPELRGQLVFDPVQGEIAPRAVTRFSVEINETAAAAPTAMTMAPMAAVIGPPSPYGSRVMSTWRCHDFGFGLLDDLTHNVDIEGVHWTPQAADVQFDHFPRFSMALAHAALLPDEAVDPATGTARYPNSGIVAT